jgi:hypothetical protein
MALLVEKRAGMAREGRRREFEKGRERVPEREKEQGGLCRKK